MSSEMKILDRWPLDRVISLARVHRYPDAIYHSLFIGHMLPGHPILPSRSILRHFAVSLPE